MLMLPFAGERGKNLRTAVTMEGGKSSGWVSLCWVNGNRVYLLNVAFVRDFSQIAESRE